MSNIKMVAAIVVYNKKIEESITCRRIQNLPDLNVDILVVDNSETVADNERYCEDRGIRYISMNGNAGLSKAYNVAVEASKNADIIIFFDDDTEVSEEYFTVLVKAVDEQPDIDIFAPIIYGQDGVIYSPNEFNFLRNHFISTPDQEVAQDSFNAIASCLAVRMRVFDGYRFNEKLFVDQVDQFFFCEQRKRGMKFGILPVKILQNFYQRGNTLTSEAGWRRLRLRIVDVMRHARLMEEFKYVLMGYVKCCGLGIQIGKKSKSIGVMVKSIVLSTKLLIKPK